MIEREPKQTIIAELNQSLKDESLEDVEIPTVQSIAHSIGIDEPTLYSWLHTDITFARQLHEIRNIKEVTNKMLRKFPDLAWTEDEKEIIGENAKMKAQATQIFFAIQEAKERHHLINKGFPCKV